MKLIRTEAADVALEKSGGAYPEHTTTFLPGILETSDDLFAAIDAQLKLVAFNGAFRRGVAEISGASPQIDGALDEVLPEVAKEGGTVAALAQRAFAGEALRFSLEFVDKNGQPRYFDASLSPVRDPAGIAVVVALVLRDVTEKRVAEQKFQGILEATPDAMLVVSDGVIEFANSQLEAMFGYAKGALKGASLEQLVPERLRERHALQRIGFERQPKTRPMGVGLDLSGMKADGHEFPVEISLSPLQTNGQRLVIAAVRDISARKRAEDDIRREAAELRKQVAMWHRRQAVPSDLEVYRAGFEQAATAFVHYAPDGRIKRVNRCFCDLLGFSREELVQLTVHKITYPDDVEIDNELDIKLLSGALDNYQIDKRLVRKDGTAVWVRLSVAVKRSPDGQPEFLIGTAKDITDRKHTEDALRDAQMRLSMAVDIARVGYVELHLDTQKTYFSTELKRQLGHEEAEMPNEFSEWSRRLHPEDAPHTMAAVQKLMAEPQQGLVLEYRLQHKDGRYRWFSARGAALENLPGRAYKLIVTQVDITERKAVEQTLQEQAEELRLALRVGRSGTFQWNAQTREHAWYGEMFALYGLKPEEFGGHDADWLACLLPEDRAGAMAAAEASLASGEYDADFRIRRHSDGEVRWISARGQVFFDEAGVAQRMVGINVDVTEERQVRAELEASRGRLQAVLNSLDEGVVLFDPRGHVLDANPAALNIMRYEASEQMCRPVHEFADTFELRSLDGSPLTVDEWPIPRVLRGDMFSEWELVVRRLDDDISRVVSYNGSAVRDADGEMLLGVLTMVDITDRKHAEQALQVSERRLALALQASNTAVWEIDVASQALLPAEDRLFTMLGYAPAELATVTDWVSRIHDEERPRITCLLDEAVRGEREGYRGVEVRYRAKDGSWRWILCQMAVAQQDADGKATRLIGTHTDIHARKMAEERLREASLHDPLTDLPNRALVFEYGSRLLAAAQRRHDRCALLFIDLDHFKPINDQYGHVIGDRVLQEVGLRLIDCTRHEDLVGRLGGDEFVLILARLDGGLHRAAVVAQHVVDSLSRPYQLDGLELAISPSIGISYYPEHAEDVEGLIRAADLAMYQVKQSGRSAYQLYTPALDQRADKVGLLQARIREGLKQGRFVLHYQPVIDIKSGRMVGAEALVRLADGGEANGPATFIPIAESAGLIGELGEWVAREACRQREAWCHDGMPVTITINVSPLQFRQRTLPESLGRIIEETGMNPNALHLDVTERTVMEGDDDVLEILNRIKQLGVKVALDGLGTGYSSLSRLSRLPLDQLKVDQSFVRGIRRDAASRAVTDAIIALGRHLKLDVIGEGIESADVLHYLDEHGCVQAQGFWFSPPLPASDFARWYRDRRAH